MVVHNMFTRLNLCFKSSTGQRNVAHYGFWYVEVTLYHYTKVQLLWRQRKARDCLLLVPPTGINRRLENLSRTKRPRTRCHIMCIQPHSGEITFIKHKACRESTFNNRL